MRDIPLDNLSYSLLLELNTGGTGSGFIVNFNSFMFLVTAKHVILNNANQLLGTSVSVLGYTRNLEDNDTVEYQVSLVGLLGAGLILTNNHDDVAVLPIGTRAADGAMILNSHVQISRVPQGRTVSVSGNFMKLLADVLIANRIYVQGYPASIGLRQMPQINYRKPLVRKGIVAGKNDSLNTIIIDCEGYPGNSGGPVIEVEDTPQGKNYRLIGLVSQYIPFVNTGSSVPGAYVLNNSGYSVVAPCDPVIALMTSHVGSIPAQTP